MPTADIEARLRGALTEVASQVEPADRWDDLAGAAEVARPGRTSWRGWALAAAAAVALVVGVAVTAGRGDEHVLVAGPADGGASVADEAAGITATATVEVEGDELCLVVGATDADGEPLVVEVPKDRRCLPASSPDGVVWRTGTIEGSDAVVFALLGGTDVASLSAALPAIAVGNTTEGPNPLLVAVLPSGLADPCAAGTVVTRTMQDGTQRSGPLVTPDDCGQDGSTSPSPTSPPPTSPPPTSPSPTSPPPTTGPSAAELDQLCELLPGAIGGTDIGSDQHVADLDRAFALAPDIVRSEIQTLRDHVAARVDPAQPPTEQPEGWPPEVLDAVDRIRLFTEVACPAGN